MNARLIVAMGVALAAAGVTQARAADPLCSGSALTEERMDQCLRGMVLAPPTGLTRGIRPANTNGQPPAAAPAAAPKAVARAVDLEITFPFASADLSPDAQANLKLMAHVLNSADRRQAGFRVIGHTDAAGTDAINQDLSEQRARAVSLYLVQQGVDAARLTPTGVGKQSFKDPRNPLSAVNRRVEIIPAG
jgi:outer membrane protein OmpA-like peptidoglycan-associated protein